MAYDIYRNPLRVYPHDSYMQEDFPLTNYLYRVFRFGGSTRISTIFSKRNHPLFLCFSFVPHIHQTDETKLKCMMVREKSVNLFETQINKNVSVRFMSVFVFVFSFVLSGK